MMLFTKDIDKKLFQQYDMGSNLEKQKVIAKIFNPYSEGRWFLINSDPQDPDYLWAIVQMGDTVEVGSVSRQDLISARVGRFRFPLERDLGFSPVNAAELFRGLNQGKFYADGGETEVEEEQFVTRGFYEDEPYEYADGGGIEREAVRMANNPNWTNEKLLNEYNKNKFDLSEFNAGYLKPSKVIGGGYKSSAVAKRLAKEYLEKTLKEYKIALEIRGVMANGGEVKWQDARIGDSARVKSENKMGLILKDYGRKFHLKFVDGTEKTYDASELEFIKDEDEYAKGGNVFELYDINGKKIEEGDIVKSKQPSGGILSSSEGEIGVVEKTKDAFGQDDFQIRFKKEGRNYDQLILLNHKINEIIKKGNGKMADGGYMAKGGELMSDDGDIPYNAIKKMQKIKINELNQWMPSIKYVWYDNNSKKFYFKDYLGRIMAVNNGGTLGELDRFIKKNNILLEDGKMSDGGYMAKGGMVVTSIKDIPNFKQRLDEGKITYRGLGLGKLWDDFNKLTGTTGTRIKVDGKEYFITDEEFNTFSRGADGKLRIRFEAPFRKSYEDGGYMAKGGGVEDKFKGKNSKEVWNNLDSSTRAKVLEYLFLKEKSGDKQYYDSYNSLNELSYNEWDKLPKNIKKEIENFDNGGMMAKGGELNGTIAGDAAKYIAKELSYYVKGIVEQPNDNVTYFHVKDKLSVNKTIQSLKDLYGIKAYSGDNMFFNWNTIRFDNDQIVETKMNMGGKVTFEDKVSSIKKSLLKKKTVSPKVQKDYGKTYNKKEALESAKRIAGAMKAKYRK